MMSRVIKVKRLVDDFISLLFPVVCQVCGEHLVRNENVICTSCLIDIPTTNYHIQRDNELEKGFWGRCQIEMAAAFAFYQQGGMMQKLIHRLKYHGITLIGTHLGSLYGIKLQESGFTDGIDYIIPVPLHRSKERRRGFNQSLVIAQGLSEVTGIGVMEGILQRVVKSPTQTNRTRYQRWENVDNIFLLNSPEIICNKTILLVDDVITTGSTIESCVSELRKADDVTVKVVALATAIS